MSNAILFSYYGGKYVIGDWIISKFPHNYTKLHYVEPFGGGLSIFFLKRPSLLETINDIDKRLFNLYLNLRDNYDDLMHKIQYTLYSQNEFNYAKDILKDDNASEFR